jgi:predicted HTH transcriptional regulator
LQPIDRQKNRLQTKLDTENIMASMLPLLSVRILELAKEHGRVTTQSILLQRGYANELAIGESRSTIKARLKQLTNDRLLIRYGNGRSTWYELS